ncbi:hypothetical protein CANARDRAFT_203902 [[Candida] arabinofermentans NRRL YB-2248]|uniref:Single-stranded DNA-binding protein n=1 Tax=[Candida] arabinofermentans NRRL YB-2248 TaxID=983967 RepID=A0A1E4SU95_9ASCO|nr:hypothetical protein CANARDRAFT_203902 [[Candida] arabinofermentans NRRL YB-2248]
MFKQSIRSFSTTIKPQLAKMSLIGTIGSDLIKQTTSNGKDYLRYSIAVNSKNKGEQLTSWFNIACFNELQINFMTEYLGKGSKIFVEADVSNTNYEKSDGSKSTNLMLFQTNFEVLKYPKNESTEEAT